MEKTFTVAGTSCHNGVVKYRVANSLHERVVHLERVGHTNVRLMLLPRPMTKADAIAWLIDEGITVNGDHVSPLGLVRPPPRNIRNPQPASSDDDFVEPRDERVQVAMCRLACVHPDLSAPRLLQMVQDCIREFGVPEPPF